MKNIYEDEYEEYYAGEEESSKLHQKNKKKFKGKGHQRKHGKVNWDEYISSNEEELDTPETYVAPTPAYNTRPQSTYIKKGNATVSSESNNKFIPGPNTHTIKGNIIDFDHVANIEKIEGDHNGVKTYGIKFIFTGKKGLFRIAWFNVNSRERDHVYNDEYAFWNKVRSAQTGVYNG